MTKHIPTGWVAPKDRYAVPVLFNPYTGEPRDVRDVRSDPQGILIVPPGKVEMLAAPVPQDEWATTPAAVLGAKAGKRIAELEAKLESYERDFLKVRVAMGLDLHSHDNLIEVAKRQCEQNKALLGVAYSAAAIGFHTLPNNSICKCSRCELVREARAAIQAVEGK